ncbi:MAG: DUF2508 family protein [Senegalia sp. (in: firmicutes)]|uniref:DUF2508 family protein n=1 Tax=Senegalia sp. (in: firmicutes) TaxID=1924098 RepID=UPI003F95EBD9
MKEKALCNKEKNISIIYSISNFLKRVRPGMDNKNFEYEEEMKNLKQAHKEWTQAEIYFENVKDDDLIDHAIYNLEAAKKKYFYLLSKVRERVLEENA